MTISGSDRIEIEHKGRTFSGSGDLRVSTATLATRSGVNQDGSPYATSRPVAPSVEGYVVFDGRVTNADLMAVTGAAVRCELHDGRSVVLQGAVMLGVREGRHPSSYTIRLMGQLAS